MKVMISNSEEDSALKTLSRWISRFCYNHPKLGIPNLTRYLVIGMVIAYAIGWTTYFTFYQYLALYPELVFQGQIWRLVTFIFIPIQTNLFWFVFEVLFLYFVGTSLEEFWGAARFTVFFFLGAILNAVLTFAVYGLLPVLGNSMTAFSFYFTPSMTYIKLSMFFAFATIYPDAYIRTYFIIMVKAKWLALLSAAVEALMVIRCLMEGDWFGILLIVVSLFNYLLFFWEDLLKLMGRQVSRVQHQTDPKTINLKKAQKELRQRRGYLHKCAVCGVTDQDSPEMEFRYCSKCNGYYCYCSHHINNHTHIQ